MIKISAIVKWRGEDAGGLKVEPFSGIQPSFAVGGDLIISQVFRSDGGREMHPDKEYEVEIRLPYGEAYQNQIVPGFEFNLNVGGHIIASGRILRVG